MITYVQNHIFLLGRVGRKTENLLHNEGKLFCTGSAFTDDYETGDHGATPLLSFEADGKCTSIPSAGSFIFIRFPDNTRECFEYRKPLVQKEVAEAVCICGICHKWLNQRSKSGSGKRTFGNSPWIGIANNRFDQNLPDTLAKRMDVWLSKENRFEPTEQYLKRFMLLGLDTQI